jgi:transcriptional regulator with XRE-family HTH domain
MTLDDVAEAAHVSKSYIGNLENNRPLTASGLPPQPSRQIVEALAMATDWKLADALRSAGYSPDLAGSPTAGELTYEPVQDGPDEIIVSTAGIPPIERARLKKLITSYIETIPRYADNLTTYGKRKE